MLRKDMNFGEKDVKKLSVIVLLVILAILVFLFIRPIVISLAGGLILAYVFVPIYKRLTPIVKNRSLSASIISILVVFILLFLVWLIIPPMAKQIFNIFTYSQTLDFHNAINSLFPGASQQFTTQVAAELTSFVSKIASGVFNSLLSVLKEIPILLLHFGIVCIVFFFALRDHEELTQFLEGISPFGKTKEKILIQQFRGITDSVVYGQVIIGIVQGALAGLGFLLFGVDNALVLTILAIFFSIIPITGPFLVWIPAAIVLFANGPPGMAIGFLLYNLLIVSIIDNFLRTYIMAKRTDLHPAVIFVGMIGGTILFGIMGLIIGPLILAYFITFLRAYKDRTLYTLFSEDEGKN